MRAGGPVVVGAMTVYILGNGGHGRDIAEIVAACGTSVLLCDDNPERGVPPVGHYLIGVANPQVRQSLDRWPHNVPRAFMHPSAIGHPCPGAFLVSGICNFIYKFFIAIVIGLGKYGCRNFYEERM